MTSATFLARPASAESVTNAYRAQHFYVYLERFIRLDPGLRDRFVIAYYALLGGVPATGVEVTLSSGGKSFPVPIGADGRVGLLPSLQDLHSNATVKVRGPKGGVFSTELKVHPRVPPAQDISADELRQSLRQLSQAAKAAAGPLASLFPFLIPKFDKALFSGVTDGQAISNDNRVSALKLYSGEPQLFDGEPYFDLNGPDDVKRLRFSRAPTSINLRPSIAARALAKITLGNPGEPHLPPGA